MLYLLSCLAALMLMALVIRLSNRGEVLEIDFVNQHKPSIAPHFQKEFEEWQQMKSNQAAQPTEETQRGWHQVEKWQIGTNDEEVLELEKSSGTIAWEKV